MRRPTSPILRTALPELAPFGIMSPAVEYIYDTKDSWLDGYTYETPDARIAVSLGDMVGSDLDNPIYVVKNPKQDLYREVKPVNVRVEMTVSTLAARYDDLEDSIKSLLKPIIQKAIEREFWNGVVASTITERDSDGTDRPINRWLDDGKAIVATLPGATGPVKPKVGIALMEQALAESTIGSRGVIHLPRSIASLSGLDEDEMTLYTKLKTPVVAGTGYQMESDGHTAWIFGTGPVTVRQGKPVVQADERGSLDRKTNTYTIVFNVPVAVTWSTSELQAVKVDLSLENN